MAYTIKKIFNFYQKAIEESSDPRVEDWFLMKTPMPVLCIVGVYLYWVLKSGPNFMEHRKPFNIDKILIWYNVIQILISVHFIHGFYKYVIGTYNYWCEPVDYTSDVALVIAGYVWWYFMLKVTDLLDTVFFVLRKKQSQVSFLHVYHHTAMVIGTWIAVKFIPGGSALYVGGFNAIVHAVMYAYYLLSVWDNKLKENLWWKKHLTQLQLIQFGLLFVQHLVMLFLPDCKYPKTISVLLVTQNIVMLVMFGDFYYRSYVKTSKPKITDSSNDSSAEVKNKDS